MMKKSKGSRKSRRGRVGTRSSVDVFKKVTEAIKNPTNESSWPWLIGAGGSLVLALVVGKKVLDSYIKKKALEAQREASS
jgi:hypothetical protein